MFLHSETFDSGWELTSFINNEQISQENIQQITHSEMMAGYTPVNTYTLFYWR